MEIIFGLDCMAHGFPAHIVREWEADIQSGHPIELLHTGKCFEDSAEYMAGLRKFGVALYSNEFLLCHGFVTFEGFTFPHAWVECDEDVIERRIFKEHKGYFEIDKADYYAVCHPCQVRRYTLKEMYQEQMRVGLGPRICGPWEERYLSFYR